MGAFYRDCLGVVLIVGIGLVHLSANAAELAGRVPENVYKGELVAYPGPWSFQIGKSGIILVTDDELDGLCNPDTPVNLSLGREPNMRTLRQICEGAKAANQRTVILAFDHFFSQYRPGLEGRTRRLTPDMDEYVQKIATIGGFLKQYGLGLELSLLSPLEIGPSYHKQTGESGIWMHYRKGLRDPKTGAYSVQLWRQLRWSNNKGPIGIDDAGVRVFAFKETPIRGTLYRAVKPESIVEISDTVHVETFEGLKRKSGDYEAQRIRIYGEGRADIGELDRVLVVQQYRTPEMDYFSEKALPFLTGLVDKYLDAGITLNALYSDEMHIQQDWGYFNHHDNGEFALRYVSPGLARTFAQTYGDRYGDFAKYLVYFAHGQEDIANDLSAKQDVMHVFGATPEAIRETALFRSRYYKLLQDGVVDLFVAAKHYAERRIGYRLESRAHATWAESPTIDSWNTGEQRLPPNQYEYTSNFVWSNTVQQSASACSDYFKWGDFLTGNGNDHTEGGWLDRDYIGLSLACSTGVINEIPYSYGAHWGMPGEISRRRMSLVNVFGAAATPTFGLVEDMQHRDVDVLMLYPLDLVSVDERFGSWMTQYAYANYITQAKLLELGKVANGGIELCGRRFTTLVTTFEPFPSSRLLQLMQELVATGGRVIWSGPPPVLDAEENDALAAWQDLFGVTYAPQRNEGLVAPGRQISFEGPLAGVSPQTVLTDFIVDRVYPVTPIEGVHSVARQANSIVGTHRATPSGGSATFLGYRSRDDQSASLGYETRNWFEVLSALGAYPPTGAFPGVNDNTEYLSRTTEYLACRFPNGTVALARHLKDVVEDWSGGFARNEAEDKAYVERMPPPTEAISLTNFKVNGHTVSFDGEQAVAYRVNDSGDLIGFAGHTCSQITVDGRTWVFADKKLPHITFAPVTEDRRVSGGAILQIMIHGDGEVRIPATGLPPTLQLVTEGATPGSRGEAVPCRIENETLIFTVTGAQSGRWLYGIG